MHRLALLGFVLVLAWPVCADEVDPEPPMKSAIVKADGLTIKSDRGDITATSKNGQVWRTRIGNGKGSWQLGHIAQRLFASRDGVLAALDIRTGEVIWKRTNLPAKARLTVKGDRLILTAPKRIEHIDYYTGQMMQSEGE